MQTNKLKLKPDKMEGLLVGERSDSEFKASPILDGLYTSRRNGSRGSHGPRLMLDNQVEAVAMSAFYQLQLVI